MSEPTWWIVAWPALAALAAAQGAAQESAPDAVHDVATDSDGHARDEALADATNLSILYAGFPGGEREAHFVEFLEAWFPEVATIDLQRLDAKAAEGFDVVVADWKPHYKNGQYESGSDPTVRLGPGYRKPTVAIGSVGTAICGGKLDWL